MTPLVLITGPFRSGTSAVAQVVHRLGFPVSGQIIPPVPPRWHSDWEDQFALLALQHALNAENPSVWFSDWFPRYLDERREHTTRLAGLTTWNPRGFAIKSPLYAPFVNEIEAACNAIGKPLLIIKCQRVKADRDKSHDAVNSKILSYTEFVAPVRRLAKIAEKASEAVKEDLLVDYELLLHNPQSECQRIADFLKCPADDAWTVIQSRSTEASGCRFLSLPESLPSPEQDCPTPSPVHETVP